jgi:hypothetical protein
VSLDNLPSLDELKVRGDAALAETKMAISQLDQLLSLAAHVKLRTHANLTSTDEPLRSVRHSCINLQPVSTICAGGCEAQFELERFASDDYRETTRPQSISVHPGRTGAPPQR